MTTEPILVTAAAGQTGSHTVRLLIERGASVRAFVHQENEKSAALANLGAEILVGDFQDLGSLRQALKGVKRAYYCHPWIPRVLESTGKFALVGKEVGLQVTVNMSQMIVRENHLSPATREHWLGEYVLNWAGIGVTHIRAGLFADNLLRLAGPTVASGAKILVPFGTGRHAPVASEDIARVVVAILLDTKRRHEGKEYVVTGGTEMSIAEIAKSIGNVVGKSVEYVDIPMEAWLARLAERPTMTPHFQNHLEQVANDHKDGHFAGVSDIVKTIGGKPPKSLETFVRENIQAFGG